MKKTFSNFALFVLIFIVSISSLIGHNDSYVNEVTNGVLKESNTVDITQHSNDDLLEKANVGDKRVNLYIDNNKIIFNKSNVVSNLPYSTINKIYSSDKNTWNIITNNLKESYIYDDNMITIDDNNVDSISFNFIYNNEEINLSIIKEDNVYRLYESKIKVVHGNISSLWYTYFSDLNTAIKAANKDDTIILYDDITINDTLNISNSINIISNNSIYTINNPNGYVFNVTNKNAKISLKNILFETDSFVKGKYQNNSIIFDNVKVVYKNKISDKKDFKTSNSDIFIKTSL